jgi:hypothetical protein
MSHQATIGNKWIRARFSKGRASATAVPVRPALPSTDAPETAEGLVDIEALRHELACMKASRTGDTPDTQGGRQK